MTLELDRFLWKPKPGTVVTAEEFTRALSVMQDIHRAVEWNPWVQEDRAGESGRPRKRGHDQAR